MFNCSRASKIALLFAFLLFSKATALFADSRIIFSEPSILKREYVDISQKWDYISDKLVDPEEFYPTVKQVPGSIVSFPHKMKDGTKLATYHIRLSGLTPYNRYSSDFCGAAMSSSRVWCNGKIVATGGFVSKDPKLAKAGDYFTPVDFQADANGVVDIVLHVANFEKCKGGIAKEISISDISNLRRRFNLSYLLNALALAFLFAHIIYNIVLGVLNIKQLSYLSLIFISILYCMAIAMTGYSMLFQKGIFLPFWLYRRLAVALFCLVTPLELLYVMNLHKTPFRKSMALFALAMANTLAVLVVPLSFFEKNYWFFVSIALFFSFVRLVIPFKFVLKRNFDNKRSLRKSTMAYNVSTIMAIVIFFCRVNDFLLISGQETIIHPYISFKLSILLFGVMQCGVYAYHRDFSNVRVNRQMQKLAFTNNTLAKIVPPQVLKLLGAGDITKIIPGESRIIDAILFYVQIKHFNRLAESINKEELYTIQADFFQAISPIIIDSGGFVAKYTISGCLAIFQEKSPDAITCAARLQRKIRELRRALRKTNRTDISVGIAIHSGKVAVGTIGSNTRLDTMALSEDVNITYAVGGQTLKTNTQILITEEAMPYCRSYINYVYEGHYFISNGKQILVYSALPIKKSEQAFEETLDPIEDEDEL